MNYPLVSIIIPVYNAEKHLAECLKSAMKQTWSNTEIIMVDDGSSDSSISVAKKYADGEKIIVISQKNSGASAARNAGLKAAKGEYIQFLDADDLLSPDKIESQLNVLKGSVNQVALCRTVHFFDGDSPFKGAVTDDWFCADNNDPVDFLLKLYAGEDEMPGYGGMIQPNAWLTPRAIIEKAGPWNEFRCPDDDGEFFCRVILASAGVKFSDKGINYYRKYKAAASLSGQKNAEAFENIIESINLKYKYLKQRTTGPLLDRIFARHYWWTGVAAYPRFKELSGYCIQKATELGYKGEKYMGGPAGHTLANILGWKPVRFMAYWQQRFKASWA